MTLPKQIAYSEPRLQPPPGYKDTTVPGIFSRDTLFSHGNHEPGWVAAPGMQGIEVQPHTARNLTPECLAELLGGPDCVIPAAPPAFGVNDGRLPGPPNAYEREQSAAAAVVPAARAAARPGTGRDRRAIRSAAITPAGPGPAPAAPPGPAAAR